MPKEILNQFKFVLTECELKEIKRLNLDLNSAFLLIYFINQSKPILKLKELNKLLDLSEEEVMLAFNNLINKQLIDVKMEKNESNKLEELISLDPFYENIEIGMKEKNSTKKVVQTFQVFEQEFGRTLSPMEYELINSWIKQYTNEELIIGALKEATYNGVKNFRYIDKILYEWQRKGFKNLKDVETNILKPKNEDKKEELFDYNWLDDEK